MASCILPFVIKREQDVICHPTHLEGDPHEGKSNYCRDTVVGQRDKRSPDFKTQGFMAIAPCTLQFTLQYAWSHVTDYMQHESSSS